MSATNDGRQADGIQSTGLWPLLFPVMPASLSGHETQSNLSPSVNQLIFSFIQKPNSIIVRHENCLVPRFLAHRAEIEHTCEAKDMSKVSNPDIFLKSPLEHHKLWKYPSSKPRLSVDSA